MIKMRTNVVGAHKNSKNSHFVEYNHLAKFVNESQELNYMQGKLMFNT
jgi:hypothetical protein